MEQHCSAMKKIGENRQGLTKCGGEKMEKGREMSSDTANGNPVLESSASERSDDVLASERQVDANEKVDQDDAPSGKQQNGLLVALTLMRNGLSAGFVFKSDLCWMIHLHDKQGHSSSPALKVEYFLLEANLANLNEVFEFLDKNHFKWHEISGVMTSFTETELNTVPGERLHKCLESVSAAYNAFLKRIAGANRPSTVPCAG